MSDSIKHLRDSHGAQSAKLRKLGAQGSLKAARLGEHAPRKYAAGGAVQGFAVGGAASKPRLDRPGRKAPSKGKGGKTNVNVIIMGKDGAGKPDMPMPPPDAGPMPGPPPGPMAGPPPGPMPPPGAGGPPMRKYGGAVGKYASGGRIANLGHYAHGGKVKRAEGGSVTGGKSKENLIGKDSEEHAAKLRKDADSDKTSRNVSSGLAGMTGAASLMPGSGKALRSFNVGATALNAASAVGSNRSAKEKLAEADRIEKGQAKPGEEDRKSGGRVKRATGGSVAGEKEKKGTYDPNDPPAGWALGEKRATGGRVKT